MLFSSSKHPKCDFGSIYAMLCVDFRNFYKIAIKDRTQFMCISCMKSSHIHPAHEHTFHNHVSSLIDGPSKAVIFVILSSHFHLN